MELIETVARWMLAEVDSTHLWDDLPPSAQADLEQLAKAAIRAMLDGVEPCAWGTYHDKPMLFHDHGEAAVYCDPDEEPIALYSLDALKEALDHETA